MLGFRFISDSEDYTLSNVTSFGGYASTDFDHMIQESGMSDGGKYQSTRLLSRYLSLSFDISSDEERERVIKTFSPRKPLTHIVTRGKLSRQIVAYVDRIDVPQETIYAAQNVKLTLLCPDPYFYSMDDYGKDIARITPQFAFPLAFSPSVIAGYSTAVQDIVLTNDGHDICGIRLKIVANRDCSNVTIMKQATGEYIKFTGNVLQGDVIEISTMPGRKYARLNGANAMNRIDRRSLFFSLDTGVNRIEYDTDGGKYNVAIYMYFKRRFLGI